MCQTGFPGGAREFLNHANSFVFGVGRNLPQYSLLLRPVKQDFTSCPCPKQDLKKEFPEINDILVNDVN